MKAIIQRVKSAQVLVDGKIVGKIGPGILTLLGVAKGDTEAQVEKLMSKILNLRVFEDDDGKMNHSLLETKGSHLIVSQFTLLGNCNRGRRPSFEQAADPELAKELYEKALQISQDMGANTKSGQFQAYMDVHLVNDGPVTLSLDF